MGSHCIWGGRVRVRFLTFNRIFELPGNKLLLFFCDAIGCSTELGLPKFNFDFFFFIPRGGLQLLLARPVLN